MYSILISIALAAYALILVDFTMLFQEISVNADILTSTQALYSAESAVEKSFMASGSIDLASRNMWFTNEKDILSNNMGGEFLTYNEGIDSNYLERKMSLSEIDLKFADGFNSENRSVKGSVYLMNGEVLNQKVIYGMESRKSGSFTLREVEMEKNFNDLVFEYNTGDENSELLFEVFAYPREGSDLDFLSFEQIKAGFEQSVKRVVINTRDASQDGKTFPTNGQPLIVHFGGGSGAYKNQIIISGFQPINNNYNLHFQTLNNQPIHFKITALYQNQLVMLPSLMQTIDVIGSTPTGLYQRVKMQRQTEEGLLPGLNFVHFSDAPIHK